MHLHWLKVKNIASLYGEHAINFDELAAQDLFAITGETGAGKSSILSAISLSLYGNVYKKQLTQSDLVSLGEREANVDIQFSTRSKRYQASWSARVKKKDGTPLVPPKINRFFYEVKGDELQLLDAKLRPEDVLSLDFDQFCKCVVLNQGEFAKFLISNFSERRDILEKLYPSDNLELVGGLAKRKWMEAQEELGRLEIQIHTLQGEAVFDIETIKQQREKLNLEIGSLQNQLTHLRPGIQILESLKEQSLKFNLTQSKRVEAEKAQSERTTQFNESLNKMTLFKQSHDKFQEEYDLQFEKLTQDEKLLQGLLHKKSQLDQLAQLIEERKKNIKRAQDKLESISKDITSLDQNLRGISLHFPTFTDYQSLDWGLVDRLIFELPRLRLEKESSLAELADSISKGKMLSQQLEKIRSEKVLIPNHQQNQKERTHILDELREKLSRQKSIMERRQEILTKLESFKKVLEPQKIRLEELKVLKESQHLQSLIDSLRTHLKSHPQQDCPLCSQHLPSDFKNLLAAASSISSENDYQKLFQLEEKKLAQIETQVEGLQTELLTLAPFEINLEVQLLALQTQHNELSELERQCELLEGQIKEARDQYRLKKEKSDKFSVEAQSLEDYFEKIAAHLSVLSTETSLLTVLESLKKDHQNQKIKDEKERTLKTFQNQKEELERELTEETKTLEERVESYVSDLNIFKSAWADFQKIYPQGDSPELRLKKLRDDQKQLQLRDQVIQVELRQKERDLADARSLTQRIMDQIKQIELLFLEEKNKMSQSLELDVAIEEASKILDPFIEERRSQILRLEQDMQASTTKVGFLNRQIEDDRDRSQKLEHLNHQLKKFDGENQRWKRVLDVLGLDDMRTYVLSLVELALIKQTNFELSKLINGRYEILQNQKKGKLTPEFLVIDHWSDGMVRKVSTLSGGETFMVSLAMALALAEMARGRADIDSFFIDEGFGTLDEDSLEDVVGMLQQVRSRGKQIGLITHVKNLSQRLPINLRVVKDEGGHSHTHVLYN